jgi:hypothetical protein
MDGARAVASLALRDNNHTFGLLVRRPDGTYVLAMDCREESVRIQRISSEPSVAVISWAVRGRTRCYVAVVETSPGAWHYATHTVYMDDADTPLPRRRGPLQTQLLFYAAYIAYAGLIRTGSSNLITDLGELLDAQAGVAA